MKIIYNNYIFVLGFLYYNLLETICREIEPLKFNQLLAFPNTYESPTMSEQIPEANFTAPWLSRALFEEDPRRKIRLKEFLNTIRYSMYQLTRGETEQLFVFADMNHDDLIDQKEWDAFTALFVFPFEACDADNNYILNEEEFKACWDADPKTKFVIFRRRFEDKKYELLMSAVASRGNNEINFSDYLFIRRTLFGWRECHSTEKYIAASNFKCALRTAVPNKYHMKMDHQSIYQAGLRLANDKALIELDYISYLRILYFTYVFSIFGNPQDVPWIEKTHFIKGVREDRFPTNFEEEEIHKLYDLVNVNHFQKNIMMSFESWCFFFNLHRLFNKYSMERPLQLNEAELLKLLDDYLAPYAIVLSVDEARTNFTESQYMEVSMILQRLRLNERDFYFSFKSKDKQDASATPASEYAKNNTNATYYENHKNETNRKILFSTMCGIDKRYLTKENFYRAFLWGNLFTQLAIDKRWLVAVSTCVEKLPTAYETASPPIGLLNRNNYVVYKSVPRDLYIDILTFIQLENYQYKFELHNISSNELINETFLKIILKDYGMINLPDSVIDLAKQGYDSLRRRNYYPFEVIKYMTIVQAAAGENVRNHEYLSLFNLKLNNDYSRRFMGFPRRHASSPLV